MISDSLHRLDTLLNTLPPILRAISPDEFSAKPNPDKWSKKEVLGHLIDSATNNHQRFVRAQFEDVPHVVYRQMEWNSHSYHQQTNQSDIISFWETYNRHLLRLLQHIPTELLDRRCDNGSPEPPTLAFIIQDYVAHMEHHLRQITPY